MPTPGGMENPMISEETMLVIGKSLLIVIVAIVVGCALRYYHII
jgi:hypothetical protein